MTKTSNTPKLFFIGYTNIDINITPVEKNILPGGAAYFGAVTASLFTQPVGLVTRIGKDFDPSFLLSRVLKDGVHVIADGENGKSIQTYHSLEDLTDRDIELEWGVNPEVCPKDIPLEWLNSAEHIHIGTMPPKQQHLFLKFLRDQKVKAKISIDTDSYLLKDSASKEVVVQNFGMADLVFANKMEYKELQQAVDAAPEAVVKLDKDGAEYKQYGKVVEKVNTNVVDAVDVTGAGDVFAGTFLASRVNGASIKEALVLATKTATESVTQKGVDHLFL